MNNNLAQKNKRRPSAPSHVPSLGAFRIGTIEDLLGSTSLVLNKMAAAFMRVSGCVDLSEVNPDVGYDPTLDVRDFPRLLAEAAGQLQASSLELGELRGELREIGVNAAGAGPAEPVGHATSSSDAGRSGIFRDGEDARENAVACLDQAQQTIERLTGLVSICKEDEEMNDEEYASFRTLAAGLATNIAGARIAVDELSGEDTALDAAAEE